MQKVLFFFFAFGLSLSAYAQRYLTQSGYISFYSKAPLENIEAFNNQASSVINAANGEIAFSLLMKGFRFEKALMQEHFNEKYAESEKHPKATFKGIIEDFSLGELDNKFKKYTVKGTLTIKGISKSIETVGEVRKENERIEANAVFDVLLSDFGIKIPMPVKDNISNTIKITVKMLYDKMD